MTLKLRFSPRSIRNTEALAGPGAGKPANVMIGSDSGQAILIIDYANTFEGRSIPSALVYRLGVADTDKRIFYLVTDPVRLLNAVRGCLPEEDVGITSLDTGLKIDLGEGDDSVSTLVEAARVTNCDIPISLPYQDPKLEDMVFDGRRWGGYISRVAGDANQPGLLLIQMDDPTDRYFLTRVLTGIMPKMAAHFACKPGEKLVAAGTAELPDETPAAAVATRPVPPRPVAPLAPKPTGAAETAAAAGKPPKAPKAPKAPEVQAESDGTTVPLPRTAVPAEQDLSRPESSTPTAPAAPVVESEEEAVGKGEPPVPEKTRKRRTKTKEETMPEETPAATPPADAVEAAAPATAATEEQTPADVGTADGIEAAGPDEVVTDADSGTDGMLVEDLTGAEGEPGEDGTDTEGRPRRTRRSSAVLDEEARRRLVERGWCVVPPTTRIFEDVASAGQVLEQAVNGLAAYMGSLAAAVSTLLARPPVPAEPELPTDPDELRKLIGRLVDRLAGK